MNNPPATPTPPGGENDPLDPEFEVEDLDLDAGLGAVSPDEPADEAPLVDTPDVDFSEDEMLVVFDDEEESTPAPARSEAEMTPSPEPAPIPATPPASTEMAPPAATAGEEATTADSLPGEELPPAGDAPPEQGGDIAEPAPKKPADDSSKGFVGFLKRGMPQKPLEWVSLAFLAVFLVLGVYTLADGINKSVAPPSNEEPARSVPDKVEGKHVTFRIEDVYWRDRRDGDPGSPIYKILPEMKVRVESGGQAAFILVLFKNQNGDIVGDAVNHRVEGGKFVNTGSAEAVFSGSGGFTNRVYYAEYVEFDFTDRWTITIRESSDNENWSDTAFFEIPSGFQSR